MLRAILPSHLIKTAKIEVRRRKQLFKLLTKLHWQQLMEAHQLVRLNRQPWVQFTELVREIREHMSIMKIAQSAKVSSMAQRQRPRTRAFNCDRKREVRFLCPLLKQRTSHIVIRQMTSCRRRSTKTLVHIERKRRSRSNNKRRRRTSLTMSLIRLLMPFPEEERNKKLISHR